MNAFDQPSDAVSNTVSFKYGFMLGESPGSEGAGAMFRSVGVEDESQNIENWVSRF